MTSAVGFSKINFYLLESLVAIVTGLLLVTMSLPRIASSIAAIPGDHVVNSIQAGHAVKAGKLRILENSRQQMANWTMDGRAHTDLGLAQTWKAYHLGYNSRGGKEELKKAIASIKTGLALAPANTYAWLRLAHNLYIQNNKATEEISEAIRMSLATGPYEPRALIPRLALAFEIWPDISSSEKEILTRNIVLAVRLTPKKVANMALKNGDAEWIIRKALKSGYPDELLRFNKFYYSAPLP